MEHNTALEAEFQHFFVTNFPVVKNFARMLLKSETEAEDVAQDVFLKLWMQPDLWQGKQSIDGYIYQTTKNIILNRFKHMQVEENYRQEKVTESLMVELRGEEGTLEQLYYKEMQMLIRLTLERLPEKRRNIFMMSRYQEMSNKEIAEQLQISVRTVEHQIYLVLSELRKKIFLLFF